MVDYEGLFRCPPNDYAPQHNGFDLGIAQDVDLFKGEESRAGCGLRTGGFLDGPFPPERK
jgi:hypothetical protein